MDWFPGIGQPPRTDGYPFWLPDHHFCAPPSIALIAGKQHFHREILLEKNINEDLFQWILGYPCAVEEAKSNNIGKSIIILQVRTWEALLMSHVVGAPRLLRTRPTPLSRMQDVNY